MRIGNWLGGVAVWAALLASCMGGRAAETERVQPVPLGGTLQNQSGDRYFGVYVPTRFGGVLTIQPSSGTIERLMGPDARPRQNGQEVGQNAQGWYTFRVAGSKGTYDVETTFVQVGQAARMPWNFYYWPTKADAVHEPWSGWDGRVNTRANPYSDDVQAVPFGSSVGPGQDIVLAGPNGLLETMPGAGDTATWFPNLYDDLTWRADANTLYNTPSPMLKYDQLFRSSSRNWEAANAQNQDIQRWPGHCLGGAIASIMLNEPIPAPGSGLTADELKGLWSELGENHYNHQIGDNVNDVPAGPPRPGWDPTDAYVSRFHSMLETHIRGERKALLANLRGFPPTGKPNEVWNHGVGKYVAKYHAVPGGGARQVKVELELYANSGSNLNDSDPKPRINKYEYIIVYAPNGQVDETAGNLCDWLSVGGEAMFAPLNVMEVRQSRWQGHNPMITESNVRAVDMANGGGGFRFAGAPPEFRPVGSYEAGRGPIFAAFGNRDRDGVDASPDAPRRGGLFRLFGGGR